MLSQSDEEISGPAFRFWQNNEEKSAPAFGFPPNEEEIPLHGLVKPLSDKEIPPPAFRRLLSDEKILIFRGNLLKFGTFPQIIKHFLYLRCLFRKIVDN